MAKDAVADQPILEAILVAQKRRSSDRRSPVDDKTIDQFSKEHSLPFALG